MALATPAFRRSFGAGQGLNGFVYSRGSSGTFADKLGIVKTASTDVPRLAFDSASLFCRGLRTEPAAANVCLQSAAFDNASWTKALCTVSANAVAAPDGNISGDRISEDNTATNTHLVHQTTTAIAPTSLQCFSIWAKKAQRNLVIKLKDQAGSSAINACFDLALGSVAQTTAGGNGVVARAMIEAWPGGWFRCSLAGTPNTSGTVTDVYIYLANGTTVESVIYSGDNASGLWAWGAQFELGGYPSSYIATTSASVSRSADSALLTPVEFLNAAEGTLLWVGDIAAFASNGQLVAITDNSANNKIRIGLDATDATKLVGEIVAGGASQGVVALGTSLAWKQRYSAVFAWSANSVRGALDGVLSAAGGAAAIPQGLDRIGIGTPVGGGGGVASAAHHTIIYWPKRLGDETLRQLRAV